MPSKLHHIALMLCYVLAWLLPLVHEHEVEKVRAEHRLCMAEYECGNDATAPVFHKQCQHKHHDDDHCAICQSGATVKQGLVLVQKPMIPTPQVASAAISDNRIFQARQLLWHAIQPRAP